MKYLPSLLVTVLSLSVVIEAGQSFSKDGDATKFCEGLPLVGYVAGAVHAAAGNHEEAKRASAKATGATLGAIGVLGGGLVMGPAGAMMAGAGFGALGNFAEAEIAKNHINDEVVRAECAKHELKDYLLNMAFTSISGGVSTGVSNMAKKEFAYMGFYGLQGIGGMICGNAAAALFPGIPQALLPKNGLAVMRGTMALKDRNMLQVRANPDGKVTLVPVCESWEMFDIFQLTDNKVMIRSVAHEKFLCSDPEGSIRADREHAQNWEIFEIVPIQGSQVYFKTAHGHNVVVSEAGDEIVGRFDVPGSVFVMGNMNPGILQSLIPEEGLIQKRATVAVKSRGSNNQFIRATPEGILDFVPRCGAWEEFEIYKLAQNQIMIRSAHQKFLCSTPDGCITADRYFAREWEIFQAFGVGGNEFQFKNAHGQNVFVNGDRLAASNDAEPSVFICELK